MEEFLKVKDLGSISTTGLCTTPYILHPAFEKLFSGVEVGHSAQKIGLGDKMVFEMDPWLIKIPSLPELHHQVHLSHHQLELVLETASF